MSKTTKMSLTRDEFDTSLDTLTQIWPNKVDKMMLGSVKKRRIGLNVTNKALNLKTQWLPPRDTLKELSQWW